MFTPKARFVYIRLITDAKAKKCLKAQIKCEVVSIVDQKILKASPNII